jgi:hypothetical protein
MSHCNGCVPRRPNSSRRHPFMPQPIHPSIPHYIHPACSWLESGHSSCRAHYAGHLFNWACTHTPRLKHFILHNFTARLVPARQKIDIKDSEIELLSWQTTALPEYKRALFLWQEDFSPNKNGRSTLMLQWFCAQCLWAMSVTVWPHDF